MVLGSTFWVEKTRQIGSKDRVFILLYIRFIVPFFSQPFMKLYNSTIGVGSILGNFAFEAGLRLLQALLGFVALKPTYILPMLLRNAKPNSGRFRNRASKLSILINLAVFLASSNARKRLLVVEHRNAKLRSDFQCTWDWSFTAVSTP